MIDFFSPPLDRILNRLPVHMHRQYWKIRGFVKADGLISDAGYGAEAHDDLACYFLSVWVIKMAHEGHLQLNPKQLSVFASIGRHCAQKFAYRKPSLEKLSEYLDQQGLFVPS